MIQFMVIGPPRSGTAWAAVWLTTFTRMCVHDPLWDVHYLDFDKIAIPSRVVGIACTGLGFWPDWVNEHPARKLILHRDPKEVDLACAREGLPAPPARLFANLDKIRGLHMDWSALWSSPDPIHRHLFPREPFDRDRHAMLRAMKITAMWRMRVQDPAVLERLKGGAFGTPD